jgi:excisionase family DNA binding protein
LCHHASVSDKRFLQLPDVADMLDISMSQVYALVRRGDLRAIKIGGRGQWRVENSALEDYIQRCYAETDAAVQSGRVELD